MYKMYLNFDVNRYERHKYEMKRINNFWLNFAPNRPKFRYSLILNRPVLK